MHQLLVTCFDLDDCDTDHEVSIFKSPVSTNKASITKHPREAPYINWLLKSNPNLYVIYMLRDPRDVIASTHMGKPGAYFANLYQWMDYEECRKAYATSDRFLLVKYEDLVKNPNEMQNRIARQFSFLNKMHLFTEYNEEANVSYSAEKALGGLREIESHNTGKWRNHLPRIKAQQERFGGISDVLVELGYEKNDDWVKLLEGVEASHFDSVLDSRTYNSKSLKFQYRVFRKVIRYYLGRAFQSN
jgi:hypothetical protein